LLHQKRIEERDVLVRPEPRDPTHDFKHSAEHEGRVDNPVLGSPRLN